MTPTLAEVIRKAIDGSLAGMNTCIPAKVLSFNAEERRVDVVPLIKRPMANGVVMEQPTILGVPVQYPATSTSMFYFPLDKGDFVLLVFAQRSIESWSFATSNNIIDPEDDRKFDYSDAIAIPGVMPFPVAAAIWGNSTLTNDPSSVILKHNSGTANESEFVLTSGGQIKMTAPNGFILDGDVAVTGDMDVDGDVTALLGSVSLITHTHPTAAIGPPSPPTPVPPS